MDSSLYINRELSWLEFNERVLQEGRDLRNPLLERCKFLAITASNLDEFFMVRVAGIKQQIEAGYVQLDPAGWTPKEQFKAIAERCHRFAQDQFLLYSALVRELHEEGIHILAMKDLSEMQTGIVTRYFHDQLFPVLTPMAVDPDKALPHLAGRRIYLAVRMEGKTQRNGKKTSLPRVAVVQIPSILSRFVEVPCEKGKSYVLLEDLVASMLPRIFDMHPIQGALLFRITRDADLSIDDEALDLINEIEKSIRKRTWGHPVRLEWQQENADPWLLNFFTKKLDVKKKDLYPTQGPLDLRLFMDVPAGKRKAALSYPPQPPVDPLNLTPESDMFALIRKGDILVHHPYQSFDSVLFLLRQAAEDPDVLAIKQTLYRVSKNSPVIEALVMAAQAGKQVTVLVELKARFDEENNIGWARVLERSGVHVIYGLAGLKVHCKALLVVRREDGILRRYMHLGTGNYNDSTARLYTDLGLFTCKEEFAGDVTELFNLVTGYTLPPQFKRLHVAPHGLRSFIEDRIRTEIENACHGRPARIAAKVNAIVDPEIIDLLYEASQAGVKVDLVVRGICSLRPGIEQVSENIRVISIVGRYLEHHRIYYFHDGGNRRVYLASADWMQRNLDRRVETCFPIDDPALKERVISMLEAALSDNQKAREELPDGSYRPVVASGETVMDFQAWCYAHCRD